MYAESPRFGAFGSVETSQYGATIDVEILRRTLLLLLDLSLGHSLWLGCFLWHDEGWLWMKDWSERMSVIVVKTTKVTRRV